MKIVNKGRVSKSFPDLNLGDVFYFNGRIYMKINEVRGMNTKTVQNAVRLEEGTTAHLERELVTLLDDAELHYIGG